jgi:hypothetical protein
MPRVMHGEEWCLPMLNAGADLHRIRVKKGLSSWATIKDVCIYVYISEHCLVYTITSAIARLCTGQTKPTKKANKNKNDKFQKYSKKFKISFQKKK